MPAPSDDFEPRPSASTAHQAARAVLDASESGLPAGTGAPAAGPGSESTTRYDIGAEIARGGMGVIYRATDTVLGREVAVKVLRDTFGPTSGMALRFAGEAQIAAQLQHPAIPPVHDLGTLPDGRPFLAMKLIKGETLAELLSTRPDSSSDRGRFVAVFEQICQAIAFAHAHGVIHRDLKPANVMVGKFGEVQVMDWGLAKLLVKGERPADGHPEETSGGTQIHGMRDTDGTLTQAGSALGTPAFMPPEQAVGAVGQIDARSDVFGLGAILAVVLTGRPPFAAGSADAVRVMAAQGQVGDCFARLDACGADPELVALCKRCLNPAPEGRPANADEVARAVAELRTAADERARRAEVDRGRAELKATEQRKRRRIQAALGLTFTGLLVLGGAFAWRTQQQRLTREAEERERRTATERDINQAVEDAAAKFDRAQKEERSGTKRDLALWAEARVAASQADARATATAAAPEVRDRVRWFVAEIERREKNARLVATLLDIQAGMGDNLTPDGSQDFLGADARYTRAFKEHGTDFLALPPAAGADLLRALGTDVSAELAAAIDDWAYIRYANGKEDLAAANRLFQVTQRLDPDPLRNRIRAVIAAGDHEALKKLADEIIKELAKETDPVVQPVQTVNLIAVYLSWLAPQDNHRFAIQFLRKVQPYHPGDFQINHNLAWFLWRSNQPADALPFCAAAIAVRPQSASAWLTYARTLQALPRREETIAAYQRLRALVPAHEAVRQELLKLRAQGADDPYAERLRLDPGNAALHLEAGNYFWNLGKLDRGEEYYRSAIKADPNYAEGHTSLGNARRIRGFLEDAVPHLREGARLDPKSLRAQTILATCLLATGEYDEAVRALEAGTRLAPGTDYKKFLDLAVALRADPNNPERLSDVGTLLSGAGDTDGALRIFRRAVKLAPEDSRWHDWVAFLLLQKGNAKEAIVAAREAVRLGPKVVQAHNNLGRALQATGDLDGAIAEYNEALRLSPNRADIRASLDGALKLRSARGLPIAPPPRVKVP